MNITVSLSAPVHKQMKLHANRLLLLEFTKQRLSSEEKSGYGVLHFTSRHI